MSTSMDIPGMYYDPVKKKYFKITPGVEGAVFLTENEARIKTAQDKKRMEVDEIQTSFKRSCPRLFTDNIISRLHIGQINGRQRHDICDHLMRYRLKKMKKTKTFTVTLRDMMGNVMSNASCSNMFTRQDTWEDGSIQTSAFGVWTGSDGCSTLARATLTAILDNSNQQHEADQSTTHISSAYSSKRIKPEILESLPPGSKIMDVQTYSEEDTGFVLCLSTKEVIRSGLSGTLPSTDTSSSVSLSFKREDPNCIWLPLAPDRRMSEIKLHFEFPGIYNSCAVGMNRFAIGGHKHIKIFTSSSRAENSILHGIMGYASFESSSLVTSLALYRKPTAGKTSAEETELVAGTNKGRVHIYDLRNRSQSTSICGKVFTRTINGLKQLGENYWIVSGHDNQLAMIDKRDLKAPVFTFSEHTNTCHRFSFSVDEVANVVSCPGDDCITRVWSTVTGRLLHEQTLPSDLPLSSGNLCHSSLVRSEDSQFKIISIYGAELIIADDIGHPV